MCFDNLIIEHLGWIAHNAFRFCSNKSDAEDLAQETLCRIYANRAKYNRARDFKPWALTIMTNILKTQQARNMRVSYVSIKAEMYVHSPQKADNHINYNNILRAIHKAGKLSICVRCVVLYAEGYSYEEIANIERIKIGTVKSRIAAGRAAIRKVLGLKC